jgi:hypothetical protein
MLAFVLMLLTLAPREAVLVVTDDAAERQALLAITQREASGLAIRRHKVDAVPRGWTGDGSRITRWIGGEAWAKAVAVGDIDPERCRWHDRGDPRDWSTRGAFGHVAAYALKYLPCSPPWVLDVPIVSAWVAVQRLRVARQPWSPRALRRWAGLRNPEVAAVGGPGALLRLRGGR